MQLKLMTMAIGRSVNDRVGRSQLVSQVDNSPLGHHTTEALIGAVSGPRLPRFGLHSILDSPCQAAMWGRPVVPYSTTDPANGLTVIDTGYQCAASSNRRVSNGGRECRIGQSTSSQSNYGSWRTPCRRATKTG